MRSTSAILFKKLFNAIKMKKFEQNPHKSLTLGRKVYQAYEAYLKFHFLRNIMLILSISLAILIKKFSE